MDVQPTNLQQLLYIFLSCRYGQTYLRNSSHTSLYLFYKKIGGFAGKECPVQYQQRVPNKQLGKSIMINSNYQEAQALCKLTIPTTISILKVQQFWLCSTIYLRAVGSLWTLRHVYYSCISHVNYMISLCKFLFIYFLIIIIILCPEYLIPAAKLDWEILR